MRGQVLVLGQNYEPLNVCSWRRAVVLLCLGKAIALEHDSRVIHAPNEEFQLPTVVQLAHPVRRPLLELKLSRGAILARDAHTCQYCGRIAHDLTIDHVVPRKHGGTASWDNLVACCSKCNNRKGHKTPYEAGMSLLRTPRQPRFIQYLSFTTFSAAVQNPRWREYLEPFAPPFGEA